MSPRDRALWYRFQRKANGLSPDMAARLLEAYRTIRAAFTTAELERLIATGQIDAIIDRALLDRAFAPARRVLVDAVEGGFEFANTTLPRAAQAAVAFDVLNPRIIDAVRVLDSRVMRSLADDVVDTVRAFVENGLRDGDSARTIATHLRDVIGLSPTQQANADAYRAKLEARVRSPLSADQIDRRVALYQRKAIALTAATNAKTAVLDAQKLGQHLTWDDAVAQGVVNGALLYRRWTTVGDNRVRPEHRAMNGEEVRYDQTFSNGDTVPGESDYNCRCIAVYFLKREAA